MNPASPSLPRAVVKQLRPHQWVKNVLLFVPLGLAHILPWNGSAALWAWIHTASAFACFCLVASAVYIVNDLHDLEGDKQHPTKRFRPLAAGTFPKWLAPWSIVLLVGLATVICLSLPRNFSLVLISYAVMTTAYSFWLKQKMLLDVFMLASLYTLRLVAGGAAANVEVSNWLMAFSISLFVSLAFAKRYTELLGMEDQGIVGNSSRNYVVGDLRIIESVGPASGYMAVLVLALYINDTSSASHQLYGAPFFLWLLCPLMMYWITRIWFVARRRALDDDPVLFALRDRVSWLALACAAIMVILAAITKVAK